MNAFAWISSQDVTRTLVCLALIVSAIALSRMLNDARAEEPAKNLTVPVITATTASGNSESQMTTVPSTNAAVSPTLPDAKLPQYRLVSNSAAEELIEKDALRFLLALPIEPMLIEARITLDKAPFRKKREQRIRAALKAALTPAAKSSPAEPPKADTRNGEGEKVEEEKSETSAYQSASSDVEKLRRYIAAIGREPSLKEVRWFYENRVDGPVLLLLKDGFQAFRSGEMPVFHILDRNRDGVVSNEEIQQAEESFLDCDLNRDGIVHSLEINEAAKDPRRPPNFGGTSPLLYLLPDKENADEIYAELLARYNTEKTPATTLPERFDANANGQWEPEEWKSLQTRPADISLNVAFDLTKPDNSSLSISEDSLKRLEEQNLKAEIINSTIVLRGPTCEVWLSAIQRQSGDQISLGAITDGYPLLPVLDANDDGRFTIRELRRVTETLRKFDVNGDGKILKEELRPAIRVCFGLGPSVHPTLAGVRSVHPSGSPAIAGPEWFVRMDRNKDNDLTRKEFPGTDEQFRRLDADHDELISGKEALEYDRMSSSQKDKQPEPKTTPEATEDTAPDTDKKTPADSRDGSEPDESI